MTDICHINFPVSNTPLPIKESKYPLFTAPWKFELRGKNLSSASDVFAHDL